MQIKVDSRTIERHSAVERFVDAYELRLVNASGYPFACRTYTTGRGALRRIDQWRAEGHTIEESELSKIELGH